MIVITKFDYEYLYELNNEIDYTQALLDFLLAHLDEILHEIKIRLAAIEYNYAITFANNAVTTWYSAYVPMAYRRNYDLYSVIKPMMAGDDFMIEIDYSGLGWHHQSNDFVGPLAFESGSHGGPNWRTPIPYFTEVLGGAPVTTSPYTLFLNAWNGWVGGEGKALAKVIIKNVIMEYIGMFKI